LIREKQSSFKNKKDEECDLSSSDDENNQLNISLADNIGKIDLYNNQKVSIKDVNTTFKVGD
jgi:hypothetical protein